MYDHPDSALHMLEKLRDTMQHADKAGDGKAWHHIVEQNPSNLSRFGSEAIHNTNNIIALPHGKGSIHALISGHYSSKATFTNGLTVREWLRSKSFDEQYNYGVNILKYYGY